MVDPPSEAMANTQSDSLADHAATAALRVGKPPRERPVSDVVNTRGNIPHTGSRPMRPASSSELPAPTSGGLDLAYAGAAASLAHANYKPVEPWRPGRQPAAGKAALFAHRQLREQSESEQQANAAAYPKVQRPEALHSAAGKVMTEAGQGQNGWMPTHSKSARSAAAGAMSGDIRRGSGSAHDGSDYIQRRDSHAMSAAVKSHRLSQAGGTIPEEGGITIDGSRIQRDRNAPKAITTESEARLKQETMHAAAVSMARQMYEITTTLNGDRSPGAGTGSRQASRVGRPRVSSQPGLSTHDELTPYRFPSNLHDHARRLAAQRMSSLYDEHQAYRDYYGVSPPSRSRSRIDRFRRRSASDSDASNLDRQRSRRIRFEMSSFANRLDEIDSQRDRDRAFLMNVAKRNVELEMKHMDEMVCAETGRPSPEMVQAWEGKLKERRESGGSEHIDTSGKVAVGGGRYTERDDVYSLAKGRLRSTFDDVKERAERERARLTEERLDEEERQRLASIEKEREDDMQEELKHMKEMQKEQAKAEKAKRAERQRHEKGEYHLFKRRSKESKGKQPARDDSPSPKVSTTSQEADQEAETRPSQESRSRGVTFAAFHRYGHDPSKVKNGEPSRSQPSPIREEESPAPVRAERAPSPTPSAAKSDAERLRDWFKNRKHRNTADKTSPVDDSRVPLGKEAAPKGGQGHDAPRSPVMGAGAVEPESVPRTTTEGYEEPRHATALRSHPVTDDDTAGGGTSEATQGVETVNGQPSNVHDAADTDESGTKSQNRRSKRWSFNRILGRNGKNGAGEETEAPAAAATTTERGDDAPLQGSQRTTDSKVSESAVRDSRFVENL